MSRGIYVEIRIRGEMEELWRRTQDPALHRLWDLRFTEIRYQPKAREEDPQRFHYATRVGFGLGIRGEGESTGERDGEDGSRTSALRFWSDDPRSLIRAGSGYWRYVPAGEGIRFLTWYDYRTRFGAAGAWVDRLAFRPLIGWATAWSFDRLRLWIERGIDPESALRQWSVHALCRLALAGVWIYQGLVPKLLGPSVDEIAMWQAGGFTGEAAMVGVQVLGWAEVVFGVLMLARWRARWPLAVTAVAMVLATAAVAARAPQYLTGAFNAASLNAAVFALALAGSIASGALPSASRCLRSPPEGADGRTGGGG